MSTNRDKMAITLHELAVATAAHEDDGLPILSAYHEDYVNSTDPELAELAMYCAYCINVLFGSGVPMAFDAWVSHDKPPTFSKKGA